jgi:transaldolase
MREETIRAFQDHGRIEPRLETDLNEAQYLFNKLYAAGVDYDDVVATLEREGIDKFVASFDSLLEPRLSSDASGARRRGSTCLPE